MHRTWIQLVLILAVSATFFTGPECGADEKLVVVSPDQPLPVIFLSDNESPAEKFAAQELKVYL